ncbi:MAG: MATE family efflux transporter [Clostridia bacterium]|nr:MATE family efflux transporter [Clostridia bacterium]
MNRDLTVGKPASVLWRFCMPLFGSIIFQQLYNIADSFVAGKFIGEEALAAVGNSYEITLIFIAFAFGCNIACSVVTARYFGGKDYAGVRTTVSTTLIASGALCLILMVLGFAFNRQMLTAIHTPQNIMEPSRLYLVIYVGSLPAVFYYNVATGIFSALGDSRTPFLFLAASSTANILVDILFVTTFGMGVEGVAWATFLCQTVSMVLAVLAVFKRLKFLPADIPAPRFSLPVFRQLVVIAVPSILQQSSISVGNIIIQGLINGFGSSVIAGYSAAIKLNNMVITSLTTLGNGISSYTAQNLGAKLPERVQAGFLAGLKLVWMLCLPLTALYFFAGPALVSVFLKSAEGLALESGVSFLRIVAPFYFVVAAKLVSDGVLRGSGLMTQFMIATFTDLVLRIVFAFILSPGMGYRGIWSAWPVGWIVGAALSIVFFTSAQRKAARAAI